MTKYETKREVELMCKKQHSFYQRFFSSLRSSMKNNFFLKMYLLILFPVLLVIVSLFFTTISCNNNYKGLLKTGYIEKLDAICSQNETSLKNILATINALSKSQEFITLTKPSSSNTLKSNSVSDIRSVLAQVEDSDFLIDNIIIYNRADNLVYTSSGDIHATTYFTAQYVYALYRQKDWEIYDSDKDIQIFPPTLVNNASEEKSIIPIVLSGINETSDNSLVIININLSALIAAANNSKLTDHADFIILNRRDRNIFSENHSFHFSLEEDFFTRIAQAQTVSFDYKINGKHSLVISYSSDDSIPGYSYIAIVPYSDINSSAFRLIYLLVIAELLVLLLTFFAIYYSAKRISTPIENIADLFRKSGTKHENSSQNKDLLQRLQVSVKEMLETNSSLSTEYAKALPLVQERYLIDLINSNDHYETSRNLQDLPICFKYPYFCSVIIKLQPTEDFYNTYNSSEYNMIKSGFRDIITSEFAEKYDIYVIPSETDSLYILLNLSDNQEADNIKKILQNFCDIIDYDKQYMNLSFGIGGIYSNLEGLKRSHTEAADLVSSTGRRLDHIRIHSSEEKLASYKFSINDENVILNYLILGHCKEAASVIETVLSNNQELNVSNTAMIQLYIQILNIIFKVMRMKNINYDPEDCGEFQIMTEIIKLPIPEIHKVLLGYLDAIQNFADNSNTKVDVMEIISYIDEHFSEELGLETLAEKFHITSKYLSKLIKDKLGINFVDYLANCRTNAAKKLLVETNLSINEIYMQTGFNNRTTFMRTFRKNTGLTPTEYRKSKNLIP